MNNQFIEARELIIKARESLRRGDKASAWQMGKRAAFLAPEMEDVWLVLAASDSNTQEALAYARKALQINPHSTRAHRAVEWATERLKPSQTPPDSHPVETAASLPAKHAYQTAVAMPALQPQRRNWLLPAALIGAGIAFLGLIVLFVVFATYSGFPSIVSNIIAPPAQQKLWAEVDVPKPQVTPVDVSAFAVQSENTSVPTAIPTLSATNTPLPTSKPTEAPTDAPTIASTIIPADTEMPGAVAMEIIEDTPTSEYTPPKPENVVGNGDRWIDVDLTNQMVYAYEGDVMVNSFLVSTGTWLTPTVTGEYKIYVKYRSGSMSGPGYYLPNVPYIMYFYKSYGLHGTYWHNNFGTPMSHGCVNLRTDDAAWIYDWASVGTVVNVHY